MKKELPNWVTFLSLYQSKSKGYCIKANVNGKGYLLPVVKNMSWTSSDIERIRGQILSKK